MGLTVEEVNEMQDEMNKIGDDEGSETDAKAVEDAAKLAEAKVADDAKIAEDAAKAKGVDDKKAEGDEVDILRELKEQVRASNEALRKATGDYQKLQKIMIDKGLITDEELELSKAEEASAQAAFAERQNKLNEMVTIMELNPNYADVRTICSQGNLDDVVEAFARYYVKENGGNLTTVSEEMEKEIWAEPNPFKKIYELVKKYHPKYAVKTDESEASKVKEAEEAAKKIAAEADKVKEKKVADVTPSAAAIGAGGSGSGGGGWTAAKIDALDEDQLGTVPKDIYQKYLVGTLA
jgi:hypothetical protein